MEVLPFSTAAETLVKAMRLGGTVHPEIPGVTVSLRKCLYQLARRREKLLRSVIRAPEGVVLRRWVTETAEETTADLDPSWARIVILASAIADRAGRLVIEEQDFVLAVVAAAQLPLGADAVDPARAARRMADRYQCARAKKLAEEELRAARERPENDPFDFSDPSPTPESQEPEPAEDDDAAGDPDDAWKAQSECPNIAKLGRDLTAEAAEGRLAPVVGRAEELQALIEATCRVGKRNAMLVGPPGCGKTAIVAGLAQRIAAGDVPEPLRNTRVMAVQTGDLIAGTKYSGTLEERLQGVLEDARRPGVIVFLDEIHDAVGAGATISSDMDVAGMLKPPLASGEIACIGATTDGEYDRHVTRDGAFERRFEVVRVEEMSREDALGVLRATADHLTERRGVAVTAEAVTTALNLSVRLIRHRLLPDKAIDVLDKTVAHAVLNGIDAVTPDLVRETIRDMVGVPFREEDIERRVGALADMIDGLQLVDSETAQRLADWLRVTCLGLDVRPARPNAVVLAMGPSSRSELLARAISEMLLHREAILELDLSAYPPPDGLRELLGPRGWQTRYTSPPEIHQALRRRPWSVVLVTGVNEAAPDVLSTLARSMERGFLEDSSGRRVPFADAIFVIAHTDSSRVGFSPVFGHARSDTTGVATSAVGKKLGGVVDLICRLKSDAEIEGAGSPAARMLDGVARRWRDERGLRVVWDKDLVRWLNGRAREEDLGERDLARVFEAEIAPHLTGEIVRAEIGSMLRVGLTEGDPPTVTCRLRPAGP